MGSILNGLHKRPISLALFCQLIAGIAVHGAANFAATSLGIHLPFYLLLIGQGLGAAGLGHLFRLPPWWIPINIMLPPAAGFALTLGLPSWVYLALFVVLLLLYWNAAGERVPLYLTNKRTWQEVYNLLPPHRSLKVIDLGCGFAGLLSFLSQARPESEFYGVESSPIPFIFSKIRLFKRSNVTLRFGNLWDEDLSNYDVVYCFLSSEPMPRLFQKAMGEMHSGSLLISNTFEVPDYPADKTMTLTDNRRTTLHLWYFGRPPKSRI